MTVYTDVENRGFEWDAIGRIAVSSKTNLKPAYRECDRSMPISAAIFDISANSRNRWQLSTNREHRVDAYFSADVETDGPIPGPFSILSFALVYAGSFDGKRYTRPANFDRAFYKEMKPISDKFQIEAMQVNGLDRDRLILEGENPSTALFEAFNWITETSGTAKPVLVAYPLSFDWTWLYWYFIQFCELGSPFEYSRCYDIKTAVAVKAGIPVAEASRSRLPQFLIPKRQHTHHALDDAKEQAEIFANVFEWEGNRDGIE
jgi:hypothetical protein